MIITVVGGVNLIIMEVMLVMVVFMVMLVVVVVLVMVVVVVVVTVVVGWWRWCWLWGGGDGTGSGGSSIVQKNCCVCNEVFTSLRNRSCVTAGEMQRSPCGKNSAAVGCC